jgi:flavin reductase (DIM6/NTAB) family NADH-FMN oxidoreductase RutF
VHLECIYTQSLELESDDDEPNTVIFGKVIGVHIDDRYIKDGLVDTAALEPIGRLGYLDYVKVSEVFSMDRPKWK